MINNNEAPKLGVLLSIMIPMKKIIDQRRRMHGKHFGGYLNTHGSIKNYY